MGKRVPEDVAVIGFDGLDLDAYISPTLSTIVQQPYEFGQEAARLAQQFLNGQHPDTTIERHVPYKLVRRESTKKL